METRTFITADGVEIFTRLFGNTQHDALILCHGLGADHRQWIEDAQYYAKDRFVILLDLRGHGQSSYPKGATAQDFTIDALADDVISIVNQLKIPHFDFVGNSLGGLVGLALTERLPGKMRHLVTNGTAYELHFPKAVVWLKWLMLKILPRKIIGKLVARNATQVSARRDPVKAMYSGVDKQTQHWIDQNIYDYNYLETARNFAGTICLIKGTQDSEINKTLETTEALLASLPNAGIVEISGAGHFANLDRPKEYRKIVLDTISTP